MKKIFLLIAFLILFIFPSSTLSNLSSLDYLILGKKELDLGNFINAEKSLTKALSEFKEIGDYILFWRARAYTEMGKYSESLADLNEIKKNYSFSPIMKDVRKHEIVILKKINSSDIVSAYQSYISEYPDDIETKFEYAQYLKEKDQKDKARKLFKEIFITASPFADKAETELDNENITVEDLIKKSKALNNSYMFKKSEKYLREALAKSKNKINEEILSILGYSLFMQKKYEESASIFKKINDYYWRGRSLLRAKDFATFERELQTYVKSNDQRIGELLINYANIKRRAG
ncbi:MAG: tetratricopeptide repeat protein, partial [Thermodesulfovibrio sp.]|nr:tetratricopeptide repeat protein [Thermodesulfovibrio sp.]